ncbi:MAG TPA: glycosyltransferase, partial [Gemmataceae bacterium]|nr:glycosyltransferase [Gemmataceae bacterium]
ADETGYCPTFTWGAYDFSPGRGFLRDLRFQRNQGAVFADELERATDHIGLEKFDLVFCHTVGDFELIGWNRFLDRRRYSGRLAVLLRNTQRFRTCHPIKRRFHPYWRLRPRFLNAIHARLGSRFTLVTDSKPLSADFSKVYRHRIVTFPIPVNRFLLNGTGPSDMEVERRFGIRPGPGVRVGYMGDARSAKGFHLLPAMVERVLAASDRVRIVMQCPGAASGPDNVPPAVGELSGQAQTWGPRLTLIGERLTEEDYAALFRYLDVVLIPYTSPSYAEATSGIFAEALALGKPVVVPTDTWMAQELGKTGGGVEFHRGDASDLSAQVLHLVNNHERYAAAAAAGRHDWNRFHNADTLVDMLLAEIGSRPFTPLEV